MLILGIVFISIVGVAAYTSLTTVRQMPNNDKIGSNDTEQCITYDNAKETDCTRIKSQ